MEEASVAWMELSTHKTLRVLQDRACLPFITGALEIESKGKKRYKETKGADSERHLRLDLRSKATIIANF